MRPTLVAAAAAAPALPGRATTESRGNFYNPQSQDFRQLRHSLVYSSPEACVITGTEAYFPRLGRPALILLRGIVLGRETPEMRKPRILVVEDEAASRQGLQTFLETEGYAVQAAGDAWCAVRRIKQSPLDCMVIDMQLSRDSLGINGLDVIALLRIYQPRAKAILMSASQESALTLLAERHGAVARLEKPLDLARLRHLLQSLFPDTGPMTPLLPVPTRS